MALIGMRRRGARRVGVGHTVVGRGHELQYAFPFACVRAGLRVPPAISTPHLLLDPLRE